jgi:hypothetical protein
MTMLKTNRLDRDDATLAQERSADPLRNVYELSVQAKNHSAKPAIELLPKEKEACNLATD